MIITKKKWYTRAIRTFIQTFIGTLAGSCSLIEWTDLSTQKSIIIGLVASALASSLSAVMNYIDEVKESGE